MEEYDPAVFSEPWILYGSVMEYDRPSGRSEENLLRIKHIETQLVQFDNHKWYST